MRILHVSTQRSWGGGEKQVLYLMSELRKKSVQQLLVCAKHSELARKAKEAGHDLLELEKGSFMLLKWARELGKLSKQDPHCILHAHDGKAHSCALVHAFLYPKTRTVIHRRLVKISKSVYHRWKFNHPSIRKIICISSAVRTSLEAVVKDKNKLVLIPSGINIEHKVLSEDLRKKIRFELKIPDNAQIVLNIGSLLPQKQQLFFLTIAKLFFQRHPEKRGEVYFAIMGDGPLKTSLENYIAANELSKNCLLLGFRQNSQEILASSNLLISTSLDEALGNVVLEAFFAGVPVLASNSGGIPDLITDKETGFLAKPLDAEDFLQSCEKILSNTELSKMLCAGASKKAEEFDIVKMADSIYKLYHSILDPH